MMTKSFQFTAPLAVLLWFCLANGAVAHGFGGDMTLLLQIKIGAKLVLANTEIMLALIASGLIISVWNIADAKRGLASFYTGVVLGFPLVFVMQIDLIWVGLLLSIAMGGMIAMNKFAPKQVLWLCLAGAGASLMSLGFLGHELTGMPPFILGNFLFTATLVLIGALVVGLLVKMYSHLAWVPIVLRILGSWISAIAILAGAFFIGMPG